MKSSPKHSPRGSISLAHHTESIHVDSSEIDEAKSPHALDARDPNYDPFDDEQEAFVDFYMTEETEHLGTTHHHVVRSTKSTPAKAQGRSRPTPPVDRFGIPPSPRHETASDIPSMSLRKFKAAVDGILEELFTSNDFAQFTERVNKLGCRLYHDELVAYCIRLSLDKTDSERDKIAELITLMRKSGNVSSGQLSRAFEKLFLTWEDILLDVPEAVEMIQKFVELAIADGCLPPTFIARLPEQFLAKISHDDLCTETFPELIQQLDDLKRFKRKSNAIFEDFFAGEGAEPIAELGQQLQSLDKPEYHHEFIRRAINMSLDRDDKEREMVSTLLSGLRDARILTEDDFLWGFSHLLGSLCDLVIDCPQAVDIVSRFLIRAVTDEVIPPAFLEHSVRLGLGDDKGIQASRKAKAAVDNTLVEWADLRNVWGSRNSKDDEKWRNELDVALREYFDSHDKAEFTRLMREWALCTSRAITVIKQGILKAMDGTGNDCMAIVELLDYAVRHEELMSSDVVRAMSELDANVSDLSLDIPDAREMLDTFGGLMRARGLLPAPSPRSSSVASSPHQVQ
jgi:hypothetical protein